MMEGSMNSSSSSMHKAVASKDNSGDEESGWTAYLQDFSSDTREEHRYNCSSFGSPSLLSDAAWKTSAHNNNHHVFPSSSTGGSQRIPKKLRFKKTRTKEICHDDSLEDTASSPVNSPKVSDLEPIIDMNHKKTTDDHIDHSSQAKGATSDHYSELKTDEEIKVNFNGKNCTDLKRRGLCLVPLSMLVNYLG